MEDTPKAYLMFLKRPWLKQAKSHHDWGNNTLTIITDTKTMTLNIEKQVMVHPSKDLAIWMILMIGKED
jgi:hypothetical protein